jgi:hypothetical protein
LVLSIRNRLVSYSRARQICRRWSLGRVLIRVRHQTLKNGSLGL